MRKIYINIRNLISLSTLMKSMGMLLVATSVLTLSAQVQMASGKKDVGEKLQNTAQIEVSGTVIDAGTGKNMAGARVSVINSRITAMTDDSGAFSIKVPHANVTFTVDAPGYQSIIVPLQGRKSLQIKLNRATIASFYDNNVLEAKGTVSQSDFAAMDYVTADESVASMQGMLYAASHSGMPGSGTAVFVNGLHSLNATSQPLYVVDGVIWSVAETSTSLHEGHYNNPLALIDAKDIEKITVLRNGSALYGAKGGNGVVVIETKRAKNAATEIEAYASVGVRTPVKSIPMMDGAQYRLYVSDVLSGKFENSALVDKYNFLNDDPTTSHYKSTHNNTDWLDMVNRSAIMMNYGVSVRGGDDRALYSFSLGYTKDDGNIKESSFDRLNIRFNSDINLWEHFKLRFDVAFAQTSQKLSNSGINEVSSPYYMSLVKSPLYNPNVFSTKGDVTSKYADVDELGVGNPLSILEVGDGDSKNYRFNLNAVPEYRINSQLLVRGLVGYTFDKIKENSFVPDYGVAETPMYNNNGEIYAISRNVVKALMNRHTSFTADLHGEYNPLKDVNHDLGAKLGFRFTNDTYNSSYGEGHNTSSDYMNDLSNTNSALHFSNGVNNNWRDMVWYASVDYSFMKRYLVNVDFAMESSSRFGKETAGALHLGGVSWGLFPSANAAWVLSSEEWMKNVKFINFMKIGLGYGISGNDDLPDYATRSYFSSVGFMGNAYGLVLDNIGNNKLKWESTSTFRAGLDLSMWENRWSVNAELYTSKTKDLLVQKPLNEISGQKYFWSNGGALENAGFNIATSVRALNMKDWKVDVGAAVGHYKNKVTKLDDGDFVTDVCGGQVMTSVNNPIGVFYGYKTQGVFSTSEEAARAGLSVRNANGTLRAFEAGDMHFVDAKADGIINDDDCQIIGDPNPDLYGNFNFNLTWKNLSVGALFTYSVGNDVYNALRANLESGSGIQNQSTSLQNRWVANGQVTDIPRATYDDPMGNSRFSDRWIEDGSYLKFKSVSVSYKFPFKSQFIQGVMLWASVSNVCTFSKYLGPDPEVSFGNSPLYQGVDAGLIPSTRSFNFGVKINL